MGHFVCSDLDRNTHLSRHVQGVFFAPPPILQISRMSAVWKLCSWNLQEMFRTLWNFVWNSLKDIKRLICRGKHQYCSKTSKICENYRISRYFLSKSGSSHQYSGPTVWHTVLNVPPVAKVIAFAQRTQLDTFSWGPSTQTYVHNSNRKCTLQLVEA